MLESDCFLCPAQLATSLVDSLLLQCSRRAIGSLVQCSWCPWNRVPSVLTIGTGTELNSDWMHSIVFILSLCLNSCSHGRNDWPRQSPLASERHSTASQWSHLRYRHAHAPYRPAKGGRSGLLNCSSSFETWMSPLDVGGLWKC